MQMINYRLSEIELENFRQYKKAKITFSQDPQKMFTIIRGNNGSGKTNIMNAITWCLYGREKHHTQDDRDLPIVNAESLKDKREGIIDMKVRVVLADSDGDKARIERKLRLYINAESSRTVYDKDYKVVIPENATPHMTTLFQTHKDGGWESTNYFDKSVKGLLPEDLATYFLFDGEKLESFFDQVDDAKRGIEDVSQVKLVSDAIETLAKLISRIRKGAKNINPMVRELEQMHNDEEQNLKNIRREIQRLKRKYETRKSERDNAEQSLERIGGDAGQYQKEEIAVRNEMEVERKKMNSEKDNMKNLVLENEFKVWMLEHIQNTYNIIKQKSIDGELPANIKNTFLNEILDKGVCICGRDISHDDEPRKNVSALAEKARYSSIEELCIALKYALKPMLDVDEIASKLTKIQKNVHECSENISTLKEKNKELKAKMRGVDSNEVQRLQERKNSLQEEMEVIMSEIGQCEYKEKESKKELEILSRKVDRGISEEKKHAYLSKRLEFCKNAREGLNEVTDELLTGVRDKVQEYTKKYFLEFLWKKDTYDDVVIDDNYNITARHVEGYGVRGGLAMGEKLVLALSFMAALRKITGFGFPLIIDTPLGRVSGEPRHNIARALPAFLKGTQVTMLVTDAEYNAEIQDDDNGKKFPSVYETLNKHVGCYYRIDYAKAHSIIKKVG